MNSGGVRCCSSPPPEWHPANTQLLIRVLHEIAAVSTRRIAARYLSSSHPTSLPRPGQPIKSILLRCTLTAHGVTHAAVRHHFSYLDPRNIHHHDTTADIFHPCLTSTMCHVDWIVERQGVHRVLLLVLLLLAPTCFSYPFSLSLTIQGHESFRTLVNTFYEYTMCVKWNSLKKTCRSVMTKLEDKKYKLISVRGVLIFTNINVIWLIFNKNETIGKQ